MNKTLLHVLIVGELAEDSDAVTRVFRGSRFLVKAQRVADRGSLQTLLGKSHWDVVLSRHNVTALRAETILEVIGKASPDTPLIVYAGRHDHQSIAALLDAGVRDAIPDQEGAHLVAVITREMDNATQRRHLRAAERARDEFENKLKALTGTLRDALCYSQDGMHVETNEAYRELFGYAHAHELEGIPFLNLVKRADQPAIKEAFRRAAKGETATAAFTAIRPDGAEFGAELRIQTVMMRGEACQQISVYGASGAHARASTSETRATPTPSGTPPKAAATTPSPPKRTEAPARSPILEEVQMVGEDLTGEALIPESIATPEALTLEPLTTSQAGAEMMALEDTGRGVAAKAPEHPFHTVLAGAPQRSALIYFDIVGLSDLNTAKGRAAGDEAIAAVESALASVKDGRVARFPGGDLAILTLGSETLAQTIRQAMTLRWKREGLTVVSGVAPAVAGESPADWVARARGIAEAALPAGRTRHAEYATTPMTGTPPIASAPSAPTERELSRSTPPLSLVPLPESAPAIQTAMIDFDRAAPAPAPAPERRVAPTHPPAAAQASPGLRLEDVTVLYEPIVPLHGDAIEQYDVLLLRDDKRVTGEMSAPADKMLLEHLVSQAASLDRDKRVARFFLKPGVAFMRDFEIVKQLKTLTGTLAPPRVGFAIDVDTLRKYPSETQAFTKALKRLNLPVLLDGFGSSDDDRKLAAEIHANILRLDRELFVALAKRHTEEAEEAIVHGVNMAKELNRHVIAPAITGADMLSVLYRAEVDYVQGPYFQEAGPEPAYDFGGNEVVSTDVTPAWRSGS